MNLKKVAIYNCYLFNFYYFRPTITSNLFEIKLTDDKVLLIIKIFMHVFTHYQH